MTDRTWIGEALAAFDQGLTEQAGREGFAEPSFWISRAQAAAAIEQARQARIGNLIAWKQLRQSAPATALTSGGDLITAEIEAALGITEPAPEAGAEREVVALVPGTLAADLAAEVFREHVADMGADDPVGRAEDIATLSAMADLLERGA